MIALSTSSGVLLGCLKKTVSDGVSLGPERIDMLMLTSISFLAERNFCNHPSHSLTRRRRHRKPMPFLGCKKPTEQVPNRQCLDSSLSTLRRPISGYTQRQKRDFLIAVKVLRGSKIAKNNIHLSSPDQHATVWESPPIRRPITTFICLYIYELLFELATDGLHTIQRGGADFFSHDADGESCGIVDEFGFVVGDLLRSSGELLVSGHQPFRNPVFFSQQNYCDGRVTTQST